MKYVVVTKVAYPPSLEKQALEAGRRTVEFASSMTGLNSISLHQSTDGNETMMVWEWESQRDCEEGMTSDQWAQHTMALNELIPSDQIEFSFESYLRIK